VHRSGESRGRQSEVTETNLFGMNDGNLKIFLIYLSDTSLDDGIQLPLITVPEGVDVLE